MSRSETTDVADLRLVERAGGVRIGYRVAGRGPLVVLIASTGRCAAELRPIAEALNRHGFRVARPEPRGIAPSVGPMTCVTFHDFAADFAAVVEAERAAGTGRPTIVAGHAYGTWIARMLAADRPDLVDGIVLLAAGARAWPPALSAAITAINDPATPPADRLAALRLGFFADGNDASEWLEGWHPEVVAAQRAARSATPQADWWASGTAPILDLMGGADPFRPTGSETELSDAFGDRVTALAIPGASHAMPAEKPEEAAAAIAVWWRRLEG